MQGISRLALLAALAATTVAAQDTAQDATYQNLGEIVLSALRTATERLRTGVSVSVIEAEDLAATRDTALAETLAGLPGVTVSRSGPFGNPSALRIRGADGRYLAVYVDGIKVSDPTGTTVAFDWGNLMTADVARVEVLRGSQSALWGGSAVGGVVNISTLRATEEGLNQTAALEAGSYGTARLSYGLTYKDDRSELAFSATRLQSDGFSAFAGGTEADGAEASRLSFSARHQINDALAIGGAAFWQRTEQDFDGSIDTNGDTFADTLTDLPNSQDRTESGARLFAELDAGRMTHLFDVALSRIDRAFTDESGLTAFGGKRLTLGYTGTADVSDSLSFVFGADWSRETATYANLPTGTAETEIAGAFAQAIWSPSDTFDLSATLRSDRNSAFGTFTTGRLALAWRPAEGTTLRASYATGFRAPSLDERFGDYPAFFFTGNPNLTPEESESVEIGIEQSFAGGATLSFTAFQLEISNLIASDPVTFATLVNLPGVSTRRGVEVAADLPLSDALSLGLAYTYTEGRQANGQRLTQVPFHNLTLSLDADLSDRLSAGLSLTHVAGRLDRDVNTFARKAMPDYTVIDAVIAYDLTDTAEAYLKVQNLTDEAYQEVDGYATAGRSVFLGVQAKF